MKRNKLLSSAMFLGGFFYWLDISGVFARGDSSKWMLYWIYKLKQCGIELVDISVVYKSMYHSTEPNLMFLALACVWFSIICLIFSKNIQILNYCISLALILGHGPSYLFGGNLFSLGFNAKGVVESTGYNLLVCTVIVYSLDSIFSRCKKVDES
ncbi:MAG: hypothetical protein KC646_03020 [Candidatus Cloacimonetes bacterium]|nr:hypothetical protein [Candidatus Cloacimonadota bacterium]